MTDEIRRFKYIFEGDADDLAFEVRKSIANAEALDQKMKSLNRASRAEAALARDSLVGAANATNDKLAQLMQERRELDKLHYEAKASLVKKAEADTKRELAVERQAMEARLANATRLVQAKSAANARIEAEQAKTSKRLTQLTKEEELSQKALLRIREQQAALNTRLASQTGATDKSRDIRGSLYQQKALLSSAEAKLIAEADVRAKEKAELEKQAIVQKSLLFEKSASLKAVQEKELGYKKDLVNFKSVEKQKVAEAIKDAEIIAAADKASDVARLESEIAMYRGMKAEAAAYSQQVIRTSSDIVTSHNRALSGLRSLGQGITSAGQSMTRFGVLSTLALSAPLGMFIKSGIEFNKMKENAENAFISLTGDAGKAKAVMAQLYEFAKPTAFEFKNIVESAARLSNVGFKTEQLMPILQRIAALSALAQVGGKDPGAVIKQTTELIAKIQSRGNVTKQQLTSLNNLIGFTDIYLKKLGIENATMADRERLYSMIQKRQISAASVFNVLFEAIDQKTQGLLEKQQNSFAGLMANLSDTFNQFAGEVLIHLFEDAKTLIADIIPMLEKAKKFIVEMDPSVRVMVERLLLLGVVFGPILIILGQITTFLGGIVTAISLVKIALSGFTLASGGAVSGGLAGSLFGGIAAAAATAKAAVLGFVTWFWGVVPAIGAFLANLGPTIAAGVLSVIGLFNAGFFPTIIAGLTAVATAVGAAAVAFFKIAIPIAALIVIIAGFVRAVLVHWENIKHGFVVAWEAIVEYYNANVKQPLESGVNTLVELFKTAYYTITDVFVEAFGVIIAWFQDNWPIIKEAAFNVLDGVINVIKAFMAVVYGLWLVFGPTITAVVTAIWDQIKVIVKYGLEFVMQLVGVISALIAGDWDKFWEYMGKATVAAMKFVAAMVQTIGRSILAIVKGIAQTLYNIVAGIIAGIWGMIKAGFKSLYDLFNGGIVGIVTLFFSLGERAVKAFKAGFNSAPADLKVNYVATPDPEGYMTADQEQRAHEAAARARLRAEADAAAPAGVPGGPTGYEDADHADLTGGGAAGRAAGASNNARNAAENARKAINALNLEIKDLYREFGAMPENLNEFSAELVRFAAINKNMTDDLQGMGVKFLQLTDDNKAAVMEANESLIAQKELLEALGDQLSNTGLGTFAAAIQKESDHAAAAIEKFKIDHVNIWKDGTAKRAQAERELLEYSAGIHERHKIKVAKIYDEMFEDSKKFARQILSIQMENTQQEAESRRVSLRQSIDDFKEAEFQKYKGSYLGLITYWARATQFEKEQVASFQRWYNDQVKQLNREIQDARLAAVGDTYTAERVAIERQISDKADQIRSVLITSETSAEQRKKIEEGIALYGKHIWAAYELKRTEEARAAARERRDIEIGFMEEGPAKAEAIYRAFFSDALDAQLKKHAKTVEGIAAAWLNAGLAAMNYKRDQELALEKQIRDDVNAVAPQQKFDTKKQALINEQAKKAARIMIELGLSLEFVKSTMKDTTFNMENLLLRLQQLQEAFQKGVDPGPMKKTLGDVKAELIATVKQILSIENLVTTFGSALGKAFGEAAAGAKSLGEALKGALLAAIAEICIALGNALLLAGAGYIAFGAFWKGAAMIAAGVALIALGTFLQARSSASASSATGGTAPSAAGGAVADSSGTDSRERIDRAQFNTYGPHVITIKFDTRNVNKGMKQMLSGASAKVARDARRRVRQQLVDSLG